MKARSDWVVSLRDDAHCAQAFREGKPVEVAASGYAANDFLLDALVSLGLWETMTRMYPNRLREHNGYPWRALNGVHVLRELLGLQTMASTGRILSDARLMAATGFNLETAGEKLRRHEPVMDPETAGNHLERLDAESAYYTFFAHVKYLRQKRWVRGKVFAADGKWVTVRYGRGYDGMGAVGEAHGYKLLALFNVQRRRELFTGFVLDRLNRDEKDMLLEVFTRYEEQVGPVCEMIEILLMDRGFWGVRFFRTLVDKHHIDFVTRARDSRLDFVQSVLRIAEQDLARPPSKRELKWQRRTEHLPPSKKHPQGEVRQLRMAGIEGLRAEDDDGESMALNAVIVYEHDAAGNPLPDPDDPSRPWITIYATSLPTAKHPMRIRRLYQRRWPVENQGFRAANQALHLDRVASRVSFDAVRAAMAFKLMVYNSEHIVRMKYPGEWTEERNRLRRAGRKELLGGLGIVLYTDDGHLGLFTTDQFRDLVAERTRGEERDALRSRLAEALRAGRSLQEVIDSMNGP
jgi:hypothetical protein